MHHRRGDVAGGDGVDPDALAAVRVGHVDGHREQAALGRRVGERCRRRAAPRSTRCSRSSPTPCAAITGTAYFEARNAVRRLMSSDAVPVLLGGVDDRAERGQADVVDQDVDGAERVDRGRAPWPRTRRPWCSRRRTTSAVPPSSSIICRVSSARSGCEVDAAAPGALAGQHDGARLAGADARARVSTRRRSRSRPCPRPALRRSAIRRRSLVRRIVSATASVARRSTHRASAARRPPR